MEYSATQREALVREALAADYVEKDMEVSCSRSLVIDSEPYFLSIMTLILTPIYRSSCTTHKRKSEMVFVRHEIFAPGSSFAYIAEMIFLPTTRRSVKRNTQRYGGILSLFALQAQPKNNKFSEGLRAGAGALLYVLLFPRFGCKTETMVRPDIFLYECLLPRWNPSQF